MPGSLVTMEKPLGFSISLRITLSLLATKKKNCWAEKSEWMADDSNFHLCIGRNSERFYIFLHSNFLMQISIYKKIPSDSNIF